MKILALSLLRIGDFFQHVHLLERVLEQNPNAELHVVCFSDVKSVQNLYPQWHFHFIPRTEIQRELVEKDRAWYRGLYLLENALQSVFATEWSLVLNPTHTTFSARLMDCVSSADKRGTQFHMGNTAGWNQDLHYLNDYYRALPAPEESWIEVTSRALGFPLDSANSQRTRSQGEIWLNPLTSDSRKNWPLSMWRDLSDNLQALGHKVRVLGSPSEKEWITSKFPKAEVGAWSFKEVRDQAQGCRVLISGDTSVPHLLALESVPMITLFLGPANDHKTAPRVGGGIKLATKVPCSPCEHRGSCSQPTQICADTISVREVLTALQNQLGERYEKESSERKPASRSAASPMADTA